MSYQYTLTGQSSDHKWTEYFRPARSKGTEAPKIGSFTLDLQSFIVWSSVISRFSSLSFAGSYLASLKRTGTLGLSLDVLFLCQKLSIPASFTLDISMRLRENFGNSDISFVYTRDPEEQTEKIHVLVRTQYSVKEAREALDSFDVDWWLHQLPARRGVFIIRIQYV